MHCACQITPYVDISVTIHDHIYAIKYMLPFTPLYGDILPFVSHLIIYYMAVYKIYPVHI